MLIFGAISSFGATKTVFTIGVFSAIRTHIKIIPALTAMKANKSTPFFIRSEFFSEFDLKPLALQLS
jgi:hypothetical protein